MTELIAALPKQKPCLPSAHHRSSSEVPMFFQLLKGSKLPAQLKALLRVELKECFSQALKNFICFHTHCSLTDIHGALGNSWWIPFLSAVSIHNESCQKAHLKDFSNPGSPISMDGSWGAVREAVREWCFPGAGAQPGGHPLEMPGCIMCPASSEIWLSAGLGILLHFFHFWDGVRHAWMFFLKNYTRGETAVRRCSPPGSQLFLGTRKKNA